MDIASARLMIHVCSPKAKRCLSLASVAALMAAEVEEEAETNQVQAAEVEEPVCASEEAEEEAVVLEQDMEKVEVIALEEEARADCSKKAKLRRRKAVVQLVEAGEPEAEAEVDLSVLLVLEVVLVWTKMDLEAEELAVSLRRPKELVAVLEAEEAEEARWILY